MLFNIYCGTVSIGRHNITNLRFADDIDGLAGNEDELAILVMNLDETSSRFDMDKCREDKPDDK